MQARTYKLKRVKTLRYGVSIILMPIRLPMYCVIRLGEWLESLDTILFENPFYKMERKIANKLKWDEVARRQYEVNPKKFR